MKGERNSSRISAALRQQEQREKKLLRLLDGEDCDEVVIIVATSRKGDWEVEIRLPSGCIRRRNNKKS